MGGVQFVWHGRGDTLSLNAECSEAREETHESATKLTREGRNNMDIANSKLNHDQRLSNTLNLTNRQKQTKTMILVKVYSI